MNTKEKIGIAIAIVIVAVICVLASIYISKVEAEHKEQHLQEQIIELANQEIEIKGENPTLELIVIDEVGWAKYKCYTYNIITTTHKYRVGVMRNKNEIHFVDVINEEKLQEQS